jgi:hypothetical protein
MAHIEQIEHAPWWQGLAGLCAVAKIQVTFGTSTHEKHDIVCQLANHDGKYTRPFP